MPRQRYNILAMHQKAEEEQALALQPKLKFPLLKGADDLEDMLNDMIREG